MTTGEHAPRRRAFGGGAFVIRRRDGALVGRTACVNTQDYNESGRVYLELADATPAEAERGMAMLKKLAG